MKQTVGKESRRDPKPVTSIAVSAGTGATSIADAAAESVKSELAGEIPDGAIPTYVEYTKAVANHLGDKLQEKVTLKSLLEAKMSALDFCISNGWVERLAKAVLEHSPGANESLFAAMIEPAVQLMPVLLDQLKDIVKDVPAFLEVNGINEQQIMESPKIGFNEANLKGYQDGTLTLGDLYMTQPSVIIKNTD